MQPSLRVAVPLRASDAEVLAAIQRTADRMDLTPEQLTLKYRVALVTPRATIWHSEHRNPSHPERINLLPSSMRRHSSDAKG